MNNTNNTNNTTKTSNYNNIDFDINNNLFKTLMLLNFGNTNTYCNKQVKVKTILNNCYKTNNNKYINKNHNNYKKNKWNKSFKYQYKNQLTQPKNRGTNH